MRKALYIYHNICYVWDCKRFLLMIWFGFIKLDRNLTIPFLLLDKGGVSPRWYIYFIITSSWKSNFHLFLEDNFMWTWYRVKFMLRQRKASMPLPR